MSERDPAVLFVDDEIETLLPLSALLNQSGGIQSKVLPPDDIDEDELKRADLVVVDLNLESWVERIPTPALSCRPKDGVALAAVLRRYSEQFKDFPPTAYALITAKPTDLGNIPDERRPHVISRLSNLEWFFDKERVDENIVKIKSLAAAVCSIPDDVPARLGTFEHLVEFLGVRHDDILKSRYQNAVAKCRPPIHDLAERSHGLFVLRWLLHRILPHTCFLMDSLALAARFRITFSSLNNDLKNTGPLTIALQHLRYSGPLESFDGPRWWRGGIEQWLWDKTDGKSANTDEIVGLLTSINESMERARESRPVITLDSTLQRLETFSSLEDVLPIQLDDWPSYAEQAYVTRQLLADNPKMESYLTATDD